MKRKKRIGTVGKAIGCLFFLMVSLFPIYWLVAMAIRPTDEMRGHIALIPQSLTGIHFAELFSAKNFGTAIINSLQTTFGSLFVSLVVGICAAYIIARRRFRFGLCGGLDRCDDRLRLRRRDGGGGFLNGRHRRFDRLWRPRRILYL